MGIGFVLLVWAVIGSVLLASYLLLSRLGRSYPLAAALKRGLAVIVVVAGIGIAFSVAVYTVQGFFPGMVFESSFGFAPTSDVKELKGRRFAFGDFGDAFLRFSASKQTIERIVASARLYEIDEKMFKRQSPPDSESPSYWRPFEGKPTRFYESPRFDETYGSSWAILCYDESSGLAHFRWVGVD